MKYYQYDKIKKAYVMIKLDNTTPDEVNGDLKYPNKEISEEVDHGVSSFQDIHIETRINPDYKSELKKYRENCIVTMLEFRDLKKAAMATLLNIQTDRTGELLVLKHKVNHAKSFSELRNALQHSHNAILQTPRGEGSRLAEGISSFLNDHFFQDAYSNSDPMYDVKQSILNGIIMKEPKPREVININLVTVASIATYLKESDPSSSGIKEISTLLISTKSKDQKLSELREIACKRLNSKPFFASTELPRSKELRSFYIYIAAKDQGSLMELEKEMSKRVGSAPTTPTPGSRDLE